MLVVEEGQPEFIEQELATHLRRADVQTQLHGKDMLPMAGEYTVEVIVRGLARVLRAACAAWIADGAGTALDRRERATQTPRSGCGACRAPAAVLHRLPGAAGVRGAEAGAAGHRAGAHRGRHRLPCVRDRSSRSRTGNRSSATA